MHPIAHSTPARPRWSSSSSRACFSARPTCLMYRYVPFLHWKHIYKAVVLQTCRPAFAIHRAYPFTILWWSLWQDAVEAIGRHTGNADVQYSRGHGTSDGHWADFPTGIYMGSRGEGGEVVMLRKLLLLLALGNIVAWTLYSE